MRMLDQRNAHRLKRRVHRGLERLGLRIERTDARLDLGLQFQRLLDALLEDQRRRAGEEFYFVQIGANDGISFDTFYDFVLDNQLSGLVVEPVTTYYNELVANYASLPGVTPVKKALHATERAAEIYYVDPAAVPGLPAGASGIASLDADHHSLGGTPSEVIRSETVECCTWSELLNEHHIERIDFLQIDTEGYDYTILEMIDFAACRPQMIKFEHYVGMGVMNRDQLGHCYERLNENGYLIVANPHDAIAYTPYA